MSSELLHINVADCVILTVVLVSTLISLVRGFLKELFSLVIWVLGFWVAIQFYQALTVILEPYIANIAIRQIICFSGIFLIALIIGALFNYLLSMIVVKTGLTGTDRFLGMIFGCARGVLLIAVAILIISSTSFAQDEWWKTSVLIPHWQIIVDWLKVMLPEQMGLGVTT